MEEKEARLDKKDKKLLYLLDFDARQSYSRLAKSLGMSKQGVEYKLTNLQKKGVIRGFYPVINSPKMGYLYCRLSLVLQNVDEKVEQEIAAYLVQNPRFFWVFTTQGLFDYLVVMWARSITEFKEAINELLSRYGRYIRYKNESVTTDVIHYQHRYLLEKKDSKVIHIKETDERIEVDEKEKDILRALCEDARMPAVMIAQKTGIPAKSVSYRIKKLEKEGIIEGYRPNIDHKKLGYTYYKLWINIHYQNIDNIHSLYSYISRNPIVLYIVKGIGLPEDLDIEIMVRSNLELFSFVKDLKRRFPNLIGDYRTFMFIDTKKVRYIPF